MTDGIVYLMFLKGQRDTPDNKYVGVSILGLDKRLKVHKKNARVVGVRGDQNSLLASIATGAVRSRKVLHQTSND